MYCSSTHSVLNPKYFETFRSIKIQAINGNLPVGNLLNHQSDLGPLDNLLNFGRSITNNVERLMNFTNLGSSTAVAAAQVGFLDFQMTFAFA